MSESAHRCAHRSKAGNGSETAGNGENVDTAHRSPRGACRLDAIYFDKTILGIAMLIVPDNERSGSLKIILS